MMDITSDHISRSTRDKIYDAVEKIGVKNPHMPTIEDFRLLAETWVKARRERKEYILGYYRLWGNRVTKLRELENEANKENGQIIRRAIKSSELIIKVMRDELGRDLSHEQRSQIYDIILRQSMLIGEIVKNFQWELGRKGTREPEHGDPDLPGGWPDWLKALVATGALLAVGSLGYAAYKDLEKDESVIRGLLNE